MRMEGNVEGALLAHTKGKNQSTNNSGKNPTKSNGWKKEKTVMKKGWKDKFSPCTHCKKTNHTEKFCWYRSGVKCNACNQMGHVEKVCKIKAQQAQVIEKEQETNE